MRADTARPTRQCAGMDEQDIIDLLELQRLTRELLDHLTAMFPPEEAADLLRVMAGRAPGPWPPGRGAPRGGPCDRLNRVHTPINRAP